MPEQDVYTIPFGNSLWVRLSDYRALEAKGDAWAAAWKEVARRNRRRWRAKLAHWKQAERELNDAMLIAVNLSEKLKDAKAENERLSYLRADLLAQIARYRRAEEAVTEFSNRPPMADEDLLDDDLFMQWNAEHEQVWSTLMTAKAGLFAALGS
jgi:hypothetical protein